MNNPRRARPMSKAHKPYVPVPTMNDDEMASSMATWLTPFGSPAGFINGMPGGDGHLYTSVVVNNYTRTIYRDGEFFVVVEMEPKSCQ